jgi:hypothetical protein
LATPACGASLERTGSTPEPVKTVSVGAGLLDEETTTAKPSEPEKKGVAILDLSITDDNGLHPSGIAVTINGPDPATVLSDAKGRVSFTGPAGFYSAKIAEGCFDKVIVDEGGSATLGLVEGETLEGTLLVIWQHRFGPSAPVSTDVGGNWPIGRNVTLTYDVRDRCSQDRAPKAAFPTFAFEHSKNLKIIGRPALVADGTGRATVVVSCTAEGEIKLLALDTDNPSDRIDLIRLAIGYGGVPRCG